MKLNRFYIPVIISAAIFSAAGDLHASVADEDFGLAPGDNDSVRVLSEVSVTAIKHADKLTFLPQASTVVGENRVQRLGIVAIKGMSEIAPNFYIPGYGSRATSSIYVRGIGSRMDQPVVGLNVDNVSFLNKDAYDFDLPDISRIEVVRGPQSTLYGRNTMAGVINIYTLSPFDFTGQRVMAETGNGPIMHMSVSQYAMLRDDLGMSIAGHFYYNGGFFKNNWRGYDADKEKGGSLRWKTEWRSRSGLRLENTASFSLGRTAGYPYEYDASGEVNYNDTCFYRRNIFADGLTLKWKAGNVEMSSITGVQYIDDNLTLDQDFLPLDYFTLSQRRHEWNVTQDFIARGTAASGRYKWLGGVYGFYRHTDMDAPVNMKQHAIERLIIDNVTQSGAPVGIEWDTPEFEIASDFRFPVYGLAAYHQSDLTLGRVTLSAGIRLDYERTALNYNSHTATGFNLMSTRDPANPVLIRHIPIEIDESGKLHKSYLELLPRFTMSYALPGREQGSVYASVSKGYKAGGYNSQMFSDVVMQRMMSSMGVAEQYEVGDIITYRPEYSWNYEVGGHFTAAGGRFGADVALFWIECRDQQITSFPAGTTTGRITSNAGRTRSQGVELQLRYAPDSHWRLNASYGYTRARFRQFADGMADYRGNRVPYAPSNTLFAEAAYTWHVNRWIENVTFDAHVRGIGDIYWDEANTEHQKFYALPGASIEARRGWLSLKIWGENLSSTRYKLFSFTSMGSRFSQRGNPLTWGVTLRMAFGTTKL